VRSGSEAQERPPFDGRIPRAAEVIYFAGLFDGEGSFDVINGTTPRLKIMTSCRPTIDWLEGRFGGKVYKAKGTKLSKKPLWSWHLLRQADVRALLEKSSAFLITKRNRAQAALMLLDHLQNATHADYKDPQWRAEHAACAERVRARYWDSLAGQGQ
jgi:hypothetical protein